MSQDFAGPGPDLAMGWREVVRGTGFADLTGRRGSRAAEISDSEARRIGETERRPGRWSGGEMKKLACVPFLLPVGFSVHRYSLNCVVSAVCMRRNKRTPPVDFPTLNLLKSGTRLITFITKPITVDKL